MAPQKAAPSAASFDNSESGLRRLELSRRLFPHGFPRGMEHLRLRSALRFPPLLHARQEQHWHQLSHRHSLAAKLSLDAHGGSRPIEPPSDWGLAPRQHEIRDTCPSWVTSMGS